MAIHYLIHVLTALALPPLLLSLIARTKAFFAGRKGPPLLQPYYDLAKLFRKDSVYSKTTTWVFRVGPVIALGAYLFTLLLIPLGQGFSLLSFTGDLILLAYLFALGRFFMVLAALDTGSSFEGMGAAREATFACLAEPAFFLGLLVPAKLSGSLQLSTMLGFGLAPFWMTAGASLALVLLSWFIVLLAENSRIPFDDPNTHLELTMIHEVMILDHSGPLYGTILYGASIKLFVFSALIVRLAIPFATGNPWLDWVVFLGGMGLVAFLIGVVESSMARLRMTQVPVLLLTACLLSAFGIVLLLR